MSEDSNVLETLKTIFTADISPLQAGLQAASQQSNQSGLQIGRQLQQGMSIGLAGAVQIGERGGMQLAQGLQTALSGAGMDGIGQQAGRQLANGIVTDANGRLRNARGQFVAAGQQAGAALGQGVAQGTAPGLAQAQAQVRGLTSALGQAGSQGGSIFQGISRGVQSSGLLGQLGGVGGGLNSVLSGMGGVTMAGGPLVASIGGVTAALGTVAIAVNSTINEFAKYETTLARVSTLTDKTAAQLGGVGVDLKEMARNTGQSVEALGLSLEQVLGASVKGSEDLSASMKLVNISAQLAVGGFVSASEAADGLTSVLNSYKLSVSDTERVSDALSKTVLVGKVSLRELATSLGMVTSIASTAGISLNEVLAAIATMTAGGLQGGQSIEYLRTMISNVLAPSSQAQKLAKQLGLEFDDQALKAKGLTGVLKDVMDKTDGSAGKLKILFGDVGAVAAATAIATGDFSRMNDSLKQINNSAGATSAAFSKVTVTLDEQSKKVQQGWSTLWKNVGEVFAPFKQAFLEDIGGMLNSVNELLEKFNLARNANRAGDDVNKLQNQLDGRRAEKTAALAAMADFKGRGEAIPEYLTTALHEIDTSIVSLNAQIIKAKAEAAQMRADQTAYNLNHATSALPAGMQGPQLPGFNKTQTVPKTGEEAGRFGYAFFEQMFRSGSVRGNPNIAAWCADVAAQIQKNLGNELAYSANAGQLRKNAIAAGYQVVSAADSRPGDLVFYKGKGYGANGSGNHVENVASNVGGKITLFGANDSRNPTFKDFYDPGHATFYRAPTSPFANGGGSDTAPDPSAAKNRAALMAEIDKAVAAGRIDAARRALSELKRIQGDELGAFKDNAEKRAQIVAQTGPAIIAAEARIARAVRDQQVQAAGEWAKTQLAKAGADKTAIEAERRRRVREAYAVEAQAGREARSAQLQATRTAAEAVSNEQDRQRKEQERKDKEAKTQAAAVNEAIRQNDIAGARAAAAKLEGLRDRALDKAKGNAAAELAAQKQYAQLIYEARKALLDKERADRDADIKNSSLPQKVKAQQLGVSKQDYDNDVAALVGARDKALSDSTRKVQEEAQKQGAAVIDLARKYAQARIALNQKAENGALTAKDMAEYADQLAGYWAEAGKAGVKARPEIVAAHNAAKAFAATAADVNGAAIQVKAAAGEYDGLSDAGSRLAAEQGRVKASLSDVLPLLPESQDEWAGFIAVMEDLESKGALAVGVLDGLRAKMEDLLAAQQALAGEEAGARALAEILANPVGEGTFRPDTQGDTQKTLYRDLLTLFSGLGDEAAKNTSLMGLYVDMLDNASKSGGLTTEQFTHLKTVLDEVTASAGAMTQGIEAGQDALRDVLAKPVGEGTFRPDQAGAAQRETFDNLRTALEGIDGASLESADSLNLYEGMVENAGEQGAITAEQLKKLRDILLEIKGAATVETNLSDIYANPNLYGDGGSRPANTPDNFTPAPGFEVPAVDAQDVGYLTQITAVFEKFQSGELANPDVLNAFTDSLKQLKIEGKLTWAELEALLDTIQNLNSGADTSGKVEPLSLSEWQDQLQLLTSDFDSGVSSAEEYAAGLNQLGSDLEDMAQKADKAGNPKLAAAYRAQAAELRAMNPHLAKVLDKLGKVVEYADYVQQAAGALGRVAGAIGEGEEEYDRVTGAKLQTPWKDLAANLDGVANAAGKIMEIATDVMKVIANPADVGAWIKLITNVVSSIADAIAGFQKANAEVRQLREEFTQDNPLLNATDYQKAFTRSRGFFADVFGGGPEVVNEIDKVGLKFAQTMQEGFANGLRNGLKEALAKNDMTLFTQTLKESVGGAILDGIIDSFVQSELLKNIIAPAIKAWSDAMKTTDDPNDDIAARAGLSSAVQQANTLGQAFAQQAMPLLQPLRDQGYFGSDSESGGTSSIFGAAAGSSFGGVSVSLPQSLVHTIQAPFTAFSKDVLVFRDGAGLVATGGADILRAAQLLMGLVNQTPGYPDYSALRRG